MVGRAGWVAVAVAVAVAGRFPELTLERDRRWAAGNRWPTGTSPNPAVDYRRATDMSRSSSDSSVEAGVVEAEEAEETPPATIRARNTNRGSGSSREGVEGVAREREVAAVAMTPEVPANWVRMQTMW